MLNEKQLFSRLKTLEKKSYPAYKDLKGQWLMNNWILNIVHVQSDPFASPSRVEALIDQAGFPLEMMDTPWKKRAAEDLILRLVNEKLKSFKERDASAITISRPGAQVLKRTSADFDPKNGALKLRFHISFPAAGRRILAFAMMKILDLFKSLIDETGFYDHWTDEMKERLKQAVDLSMDQHFIREMLKKEHAVAFVGNGSILPRESGISFKPLKNAIPFVSPENLEKRLALPSGKEIAGMLVPEGITIIAGGGYHGKSTLLSALQDGVYDHPVHDGREYVITRDDAFKIRAEDGRSILHEDISCFINNLPSKKSTSDFTTLDASGSTSQAAGVIEAIDAGSRLLLMDEDTSAANFMVRDALMAEVVSTDDEPIVPFVSRMKALKNNNGLSTIIVAGSSGAFFQDADLIVQMKDYQLLDITERAKEMASKVDYGHHADDDYQLSIPERFVSGHPAPSRGAKIKTPALDTLSINREVIDVKSLEQLCDREQLLAIGNMIWHADQHLMDQKTSLSDIEEKLNSILEKKGLAYFGHGDMAQPRLLEVMAALNRWRSLQVFLKDY